MADGRGQYPWGSVAAALMREAGFRHDHDGMGAATDRGLVRAVNEDSLLAPSVFLVADGMGGYQAGATASAIVVEEFAIAAAVAGHRRMGHRVFWRARIPESNPVPEAARPSPEWLWYNGTPTPIGCSSTSEIHGFIAAPMASWRRSA